jgi:hypothetical protein
MLHSDSFAGYFPVLCFLFFIQLPLALFSVGNEEFQTLVFIPEALVPQVEPDFEFGKPLFFPAAVQSSKLKSHVLCPRNTG